jgi:hypothetical protein
MESMRKMDMNKEKADVIHWVYSFIQTEMEVEMKMLQTSEMQ